jgi:hypothetical protein
MARKVNWSRRFPHPITPLDGERMIELQDVVSYMLAIGDRHHRRAWQHVAALYLRSAPAVLGPMGSATRLSAEAVGVWGGFVT